MIYGGDSPSEGYDEPKRDENIESRTISGAKLRSRVNSTSPLAQAFQDQEKVMSILATEISQLEDKLQPISLRDEREPADDTEPDSPPTSDIVRSLNSNNRQIERLTRKIRRIIGEIEL